MLCYLGVCFACGGEIGETVSEKGKEIRKDGVEDADGKENRLADGVETREESGLTEEPPSDPHHVYSRSLLIDLTRLLPF